MRNSYKLQLTMYNKSEAKNVKTESVFANNVHY